MQRSPATVFEWIDRIGRPVFIRILLPCALVWISWQIIARILRAMDRSIETGQPMPDMTAGWGPIIIALGPIVLNILMDQWTRARQRERELDRGMAPRPSGAPSSPPSETAPGGGLVNNHAISGGE